MAVQTHISASVFISANTVCKNGENLFTDNATDLSAFLVNAYQYFKLGYTRFYKMDSLSKLGWLASEILLLDNKEPEKYGPDETGIILANANASLDSDIKYMASVADIASPALFVYTLPNIMTGEISIRNNFKGEAAFFVTDNFDANFTEQYVADLFNNNIFKRCICGWVDVLGAEYKAVLFLIEKGEGPIRFTAENMNKVFNS